MIPIVTAGYFVGIFYLFALNYIDSVSQAVGYIKSVFIAQQKLYFVT